MLIILVCMRVRLWEKCIVDGDWVFCKEIHRQAEKQWVGRRRNGLFIRLNRQLLQYLEVEIHDSEICSSEDPLC